MTHEQAIWSLDAILRRQQSCIHRVHEATIRADAAIHEAALKIRDIRVAASHCASICEDTE